MIRFLATLVVAASAAVANRAAAQTFDEGYVRMADGVELYYRSAGSGNDVVIVPGRLFLYDDFARLARGRRLIFYDMRNRGRSDAVADSTTITIEQDIRDLEAIRRHFGVERMSLIGYSYLGLMTALYASDHPGRVSRLVQLGPVAIEPRKQYPKELTANDTVPIFPEAAARRARELRESGWHLANPLAYCEISWAVNRYVLVGDSANVARLGPGWCSMANEWPIALERHFRHGFQSVQRVQVTPQQIARVTIPVLTIHGTKDRNAPYGGGREWALRLPDARLLTIPGAAHHAWVESPVVIPAIDTFLQGAWPAGSEKVVRLEVHQ